VLARHMDLELTATRIESEVALLYMIIEHFRDGNAEPVYERFRARGRLEIVPVVTSAEAAAQVLGNDGKADTSATAS
jgi:hypothetical protein